jgi:hypothetical protein
MKPALALIVLALLAAVLYVQLTGDDTPAAEVTPGQQRGSTPTPELRWAVHAPRLVCRVWLAPTAASPASWRVVQQLPQLGPDVASAG